MAQESLDELLSTLREKCKKYVGQPIECDEGYELIRKIMAIDPINMSLAKLLYVNTDSDDCYPLIEDRLSTFLLNIKKSINGTEIFFDNKCACLFLPIVLENKEDEKINKIIDDLPFNLLDDYLKEFHIKRDDYLIFNEFGDIKGINLHGKDYIDGNIFYDEHLSNYFSLLIYRTRALGKTEQELVDILLEYYNDAKDIYFMPTYIFRVLKELISVDNQYEKLTDEACQIALDNTKKFIKSGLAVKNLRVDINDGYVDSNSALDIFCKNCMILPKELRQKIVTETEGMIVKQTIDEAIQKLKLPIVPLDDYYVHYISSPDVESNTGNYELDKIIKASASLSELNDFRDIKKHKYYSPTKPILRISFNDSYEKFMDFDNSVASKYEFFLRTCDNLRYYYGLKLSTDRNTPGKVSGEIASCIKYELEDLKTLKDNELFRVDEVLAIINGENGNKGFEKQMVYTNYFNFMDNHPKLMASNKIPFEDEKKYYAKAPLRKVTGAIVITIVTLLIIAVVAVVAWILGWVVCAILDDFFGVKIPEFLRNLWPWYNKYWDVPLEIWFIK